MSSDSESSGVPDSAAAEKLSLYGSLRAGAVSRFLAPHPPDGIRLVGGANERSGSGLIRFGSMDRWHPFGPEPETHLSLRRLLLDPRYPLGAA